MENLKLLLQLFYRPVSAMSDLMDNGSWFAAAVLLFAVSAGFYLTVNAKLQESYRVPAFTEFYNPDYETLDEDTPAAREQYNKAFGEYNKALRDRARIPLFGDNFYKFFSFEPSKFFQPLLLLSIFYVPTVILLMSLFGKTGKFGIALPRDYGALATCSMTAWAAAHLPFAIAGIALYSQNIAPGIWFGMWLASSVLFGVLMVFALRVVCGANYGAAILVVCFAWLAMSLGMYVFRFISPWLFSPFLLFYGYMYFGGALSGEVRGFGNAFRRKQNFKRFLQNATVNPRDADAHVQLGLIYLQRRQEEKALEHLRKAVEIDETEVDANYELGKIARKKSEPQTALNHFSVVLEQNDKYALSEIWREVGATYMEAGMKKEAREALEKFVTRRPVDSQGLYYLGKIYKTEGENEKAREMFEQAIESAKNSPDYRRAELRYWSKLAEKEI